MHEKYVKIHSLSVSKLLYDFINKEAIPGTDINENKFWKGFDKVLNELSNKNRELLQQRSRMQMDINRWHLDNKKKFKIS